MRSPKAERLAGVELHSFCGERGAFSSLRSLHDRSLAVVPHKSLALGNRSDSKHTYRFETPTAARRNIGEERVLCAAEQGCHSLVTVRGAAGQAMGDPMLAFRSTQSSSATTRSSSSLCAGITTSNMRSPEAAISHPSDLVWKAVGVVSIRHCAVLQ